MGRQEAASGAKKVGVSGLLVYQVEVTLIVCVWGGAKGEDRHLEVLKLKIVSHLTW